MTQARNLRPIASLFCTQYKTEANCFIEDDHPSGLRHLVVQYDRGGRPEFAAAIADDWSEQDVQDLLLLPMKHHDAPYPPWEVPARAFGSAELFRWWNGEKPR